MHLAGPVSGDVPGRLSLSEALARFSDVYLFDFWGAAVEEAVAVESDVQ